MPEQLKRFVPDDDGTRALGAKLATRWSPGEIVLLDGPLGAGKTTFVRGVVESLGFNGPVRSPTFNLIQTFDTHPPVMHADLYRLQSAAGTGIEDYLDTHICLVEWPDRMFDLVHPVECWRINISFEGEGRTFWIRQPGEV